MWGFPDELKSWNRAGPEFDVPYEPGTLIAHCYDSETETAFQTLKTTGKPAAIRLVPD
jgi:hypothetical protein